MGKTYRRDSDDYYDRPSRKKGKREKGRNKNKWQKKKLNYSEENEDKRNNINKQLEEENDYEND